MPKAWAADLRVGDNAQCSSDFGSHRLSTGWKETGSPRNWWYPPFNPSRRVNSATYRNALSSDMCCGALSIRPRTRAMTVLSRGPGGAGQSISQSRTTNMKPDFLSIFAGCVDRTHSWGQMRADEWKTMKTWKTNDKLYQNIVSHPIDHCWGSKPFKIACCHIFRDARRSKTQSPFQVLGVKSMSVQNTLRSA